MNAPTTRGAAIAAKCKDCIHDPAAAGTWREQVAACQCTDCPLWRFRPVQTGAACPAWIKSHDPADLPDGWAKLHHDEAIRRMRASADAKAVNCAVHANGGTRGTGAMVEPTPTPAKGWRSDGRASLRGEGTP